ncbi:guanitoxin biosynthesis L-enduracididine beta-hydroxylase GntD [Streptomyces sp. NRRL B-24484]|uniref:guanitoxin biosynthesis L-enduracididine beta-hydroxylase GntD n=1 Tax=Streptomyces sp. NRRL B-24484 TaxID=1463833 RepID=UPI001F4078FE|nr:guanitoxin biosynthesis L-enduracididine beta-hydroxylase GntD [Streptomyces sp. NRRL B-24484]
MADHPVRPPRKRALMNSKKFPRDVGVYRVDGGELEQIERLVARARKQFATASDTDFLFRAASLATGLPDGLVDFLRSFELHETTAGVVVSGLPVDDAAIGPTPPHWSQQAQPESTVREEVFFVLLASLLGEPFGWSTLQSGRIIHDVLPVQGEETAQSGHGSTDLLEWHTEDGFHPYRCDYLGLMALRNPTGVATTFAGVGNLALPAEVTEVLQQPRFLIRPDTEHLRTGTAGGSVYDIAARTVPVPVLFGSRSEPYLRIDPYFMDAVAGDPDATHALKCVVAALEADLEDLVLDPGEVAFVDNYRAVHGRRPFEARYDGTDRWLKKVVVARDLRKSRELRSSARSRVVA